MHRYNNSTHEQETEDHSPLYGASPTVRDTPRKGPEGNTDRAMYAGGRATSKGNRSGGANEIDMPLAIRQGHLARGGGSGHVRPSPQVDARLRLGCTASAEFDRTSGGRLAVWGDSRLSGGVAPASSNGLASQVKAGAAGRDSVFIIRVPALCGFGYPYGFPVDFLFGLLLDLLPGGVSQRHRFEAGRAPVPVFCGWLGNDRPGCREGQMHTS
jgi:hypothetical protein